MVNEFIGDFGIVEVFDFESVQGDTVENVVETRTVDDQRIEDRQFAQESDPSSSFRLQEEYQSRRFRIRA